MLTLVLNVLSPFFREQIAVVHHSREFRAGPLPELPHGYARYQQLLAWEARSIAAKEEASRTQIAAVSASAAVKVCRIKLGNLDAELLAAEHKRADQKENANPRL